MKLISLNTWGGIFFEPLIDFVKQHSLDTDIFCFQEIYNTKSKIKKHKALRPNLLDELKMALPDFQNMYLVSLIGYDQEAEKVNFDLEYGVALFIKINITVNKYNTFIFNPEKIPQDPGKDFASLATPLQYFSFVLNGKQFLVSNFHGTPFPADKLDSERRLSQAYKLKEILNQQRGAKILVGDFNLLPQTESIGLIETEMKNLIKEFNIEKTRSKLSPYFGKPDFQKFADYAFVSDDIKVIKFQVPDVSISDHLPMILEFS